MFQKTTRKIRSFKPVSFFLFSCCIFASAFFTVCTTPTILVNQEQKQGDHYFNQHNYTEAARHYSLMIDASRKLGIYRNLAMEADVHRKLANCSEMDGHYQTALIHVNEAIMLDSLDNNLLGLIEDYRQQGKINVYSGRYRTSIRSLDKSLSLSEGMDQSLKTVHRQAMADTYLALGQLYAATGKISSAQGALNRALILYEQSDDKRGKMESYLTLGSLYSDLGDIAAAENFTRQSLKLAGDFRMGTARHYSLLASVSSAAGEYEDAIRFQGMAIDDAKQFRISGQIIWTTIGMGDIYREMGDLSRAERFFRQAREIRDTSEVNAAGLDASLDLRIGDMLSANKYFAGEGSVSGEGISALRIGEMMMKNGNYDSALVFLHRSGEMFVQSRNRQGVASVQLLTGSILVDKGDYAGANRLLDSAGSNRDFPETVWQSYFHQGRMYEKLNQDDRAIGSYRSSIDIIEKIRGKMTVDEFKSIFFDNKREVYDRLIRMLLKENRTSEAFEVSEHARARSFFDLLANKKINYQAALPEDLVMLEQEKRIEMQKLYLLLQRGGSASAAGESRGVDAGQLRSALMETQSEYEEILQKIKLNNPGYASLMAAELVSLADLQSDLDPKTALLAYWISSNEMVLWLITKTAIQRKTISIDREDLTALVEKARKAIQSNSLQESNASLSKLYSLLIAPAGSSLKGISNLIIIPSGSLNFLPFQALIDEKGEYLVKKFNFSYSPSASVYHLSLKREVKTGSKFLGVALADVEVGNFAGLPGTLDELNRILPLFAEKISAIGALSTESFVRKNAGSCDLIHFATHGSYNYRQPLYSFLLFPPDSDDDGRLNVYEVFEMNLNAKLVTLSACETGLGNLSQGDELTGLSRAFLFAGSSAVVVSLWSVADYPTALLMSNFYRYIKEYPLQEALSMAQRDVIKEFPQPVYWSPFILIGNGNIVQK